MKTLEKLPRWIAMLRKSGIGSKQTVLKEMENTLASNDAQKDMTTNEKYAYQVKNMNKHVRDFGPLFVEGNEWFDSFPLTRRETKRIMRRKNKELRRLK